MKWLLVLVMCVGRAVAGDHGGLVDNMDCKACHTSDGWTISANASGSGFDHDRTGFPLRGSHVQQTCGKCHTSEKAPPQECVGCHRDLHEGRQGNACAECHTATTWADTSTLDRHRQTRIPLTGRHALVDCVACHKRQTEGTWKDTPVACFACHQADYRRSDVHPTHDGSTGEALFPRDCALCHQTSAWSPAITNPSTLPGTMARSDHAPFMTLTSGSHRTADCTSCHADRKRMQLVRCDSCHADVALRTQHRGASVARSTSSCLGCHPRGAAR
ncbi:MAG: hypothetical protein QM831_11185 [Kofleriaceae bacterium]